MNNANAKQIYQKSADLVPHYDICLPYLLSAPYPSRPPLFSLLPLLSSATSSFSGPSLSTLGTSTSTPRTSTSTPRPVIYLFIDDIIGLFSHRQPSLFNKAVQILLLTFIDSMPTRFVIVNGVFPSRGCKFESLSCNALLHIHFYEAM